MPASPSSSTSLSTSPTRPTPGPRAILIYGPTAAGKSALGAALAERFGGMVVNADALQVYDAWRLLTARPGPDALARAPHRLYGHVDIARRDYSAGRWLEDVADLLAAAENRPLVFVGGTGLYFEALTKGLAPAPPTPPDVRDRLADDIAQKGLDWAVERLTALDPETAGRVDVRNPRRVARALEVIEATGRGLSEWIADQGPPLLPTTQTLALRIDADRAALRARIETRFKAMVAAGALDEAAAVRALAPPPDAPGLKALGARALWAHLDGALTLDAAIAQAVIATGQYAKRQDTWARGRAADWRALSLDDAAQIAEDPSRIDGF